LAQARSEEIANPRFESQPGVEYEVQENETQTRRFSWPQAPEGGSKLLWPKRVRDAVTLWCWDLP